MAAGPMNLQGNLDSPGQGYWPNPHKEAFRTPIRSSNKDHLYENRTENPYLVENFIQKGKPVYFTRTSDEEEIPDLRVPECNIFFHKNNFEHLCYDLCYDDNDNNYVNDVIYANEEEMWKYAVPECTDFSYMNTPQDIMYKNKNKNTYPGYQCSFIHPHNFDINECEQNNNSINQNREKVLITNK